MARRGENEKAEANRPGCYPGKQKPGGEAKELYLEALEIYKTHDGNEKEVQRIERMLQELAYAGSSAADCSC